MDPSVEQPKQPSLESIRKTEYKRSAELYKPAFENSPQQHFEGTLNEDTSKMIVKLPDSDKERVVDFAQRVTNLIPPTIFEEQQYTPTNRESVRALLATAYVNDKGAHESDELKEMYIRAMSAVSGDTLYFSSGYTSSTEAVMQNFFDSDFTQADFYNFIVQLNAQTMPVAEWVEATRKEYKAAYDVFLEKTKARYQRAMETFVEYHRRFFPDKEAGVESWRNNITYVDTISRLKYFTNDDEMAASAKYNILAASAVAFGIDEVSGLPLTVSHIPYNYQEVAQNPNLLPKDDPSYKETLTLVHENIHNVTPDKEHKGDWLILINELLTDSSAWIIALEAEGQDFANCPDGYLAYTGYYGLVTFGRNLVKNGIFSTDELVELGMKQDPKGFLETFHNRIQQADQEKTRAVLELLLRGLLIKPRKEAEIPELLQAFQDDPSGFMEREGMEMWEMIGGQYIGQKYFMVGILDQYRAQHPEVGERDYMAIRNENGSLNDEAVDLFYDEFATDTGAGYIPRLLDEEVFYQQLNEVDPSSTLSDLNVPEKFKVLPDDLDLTIKILGSANSLLRAGLDYHASQWSQEQAFKAIVETGRNIYKGAVDILERNWGDNNIVYTPEDIVNILNNVAMKWIYNKDQVGEPSMVVEKILRGIDAITHPISTPDGLQIMSPDQLLYWGPALELDNNPH